MSNQRVTYSRCSPCAGRGKITEFSCETCKGTGKRAYCYTCGVAVPCGGVSIDNPKDCLRSGKVDRRKGDDIEKEALANEEADHRP